MTLSEFHIQKTEYIKKKGHAPSHLLIEYYALAHLLGEITNEQVSSCMSRGKIDGTAIILTDDEVGAIFFTEYEKR